MNTKNNEHPFMMGGPGTPDPGHFTCRAMPLQAILVFAYRIKTYQISAPSWLNSRAYDIAAKIPPGTTRDQMSVMLRNLLTERFRIRSHRETRDVPGYELVLAKGGLKMSAAAPPAEPLSSSGSTVIKGKDGLPELPPGRVAMQAATLPDGLTRIMGRMLPMSIIVNMAQNQTGKLVVDKTGLDGKYDFVLDFSRDAMAAPGGPGDTAPAGPDFFSAIQTQLGLKLERQNVPTDVLVIEHIEQDPIEN